MGLHVITGGSGLLGRAVASRLLEEGRDVRVYDMKEPPEEIREHVDFKKGDIRDREAVIRACEGAEVIYHLAANMPQAKLPARGFWEINVGGTLNACEGAVKYGARRLVFASTIEMYGVHTKFPVTEDSELRFTGVYSRNKLECEQRLLDARSKHGLEVVFLRMPMIFGPGFYHEKSMMLLFRLVRKGWPIPGPGFPDAPWDAVSSEDVAQAFFLASQVKEADGEAFNVSSEKAPPYVEVLREFARLAGSKSRPLLIPPGVMRRIVYLIEKYDPFSTPAELVQFVMVGGDYSIEKAVRILGYKPRYTVPEAMYTAYRWIYPD